MSGFGSLDWNAETATYTVKDVVLLKQEVGRTSTEIDPIALGKVMYQMKDEPLGLKWHWHTHPNMRVFWSGDDMEIIRSLGQRGWIIATVFNEKGDHKSAFYTATEVMGQAHDIFKDDLPTEVVRFFPRSFFKQLDEEYDACVKEEVRWIGPGTHTKIHNGYPEVGLPVITGSHTNDADRWNKRILEYSDYGYAERGPADWIYNPCHDKELKTEEQQLDAIVEMTTHEMEFLKANDKDFPLLYSKYLVREVARIPTLEQSRLTDDEVAEIMSAREEFNSWST